jgi:flagellar hook-length control protein FliK
LAAFAKSMGLDESTIQHLLGEAPSSTTTLTASPSALGATATLGNAALGHTSGLPTLEGLVAAQLMAGPVDGGQPPVVVSGAGLALGASTLTAPAMPGLSQTDMAAIQQLQITVLPAAVLPVNTGVNAQVIPSTLEMLSLLGSSGVSDKEVSALLSQFSDSTGSDSNPDSEQSRPDGNNASSFSQALTRQTATAPAGAASATAHTSANMSEVYDQLSDKMATELAARMHKQLSDGEWKMKFGLRPSNLGGVEIQLEMKDGKLDAVFRADNPLTRDLLQNSSQRLREALGNFGINAGQVHVGHGGGHGQQNGSGHSTKQGQVRDNSTSQVNGTDSASSATSARNKANASLLDLYA